MLYQRSMTIERRLQSVLQLIESGEYSTPMIAQQLGVSIPTISRDVTALRERGHDICAVRQSDGTWRYSLRRSSARRGQATKPEYVGSNPAARRDHKDEQREQQR